ncbi:MAG: cytochrome c [Chloroflexi bacterium]|nr:cytochrome c [Chloroflexota bacterium]
MMRWQVLRCIAIVAAAIIAACGETPATEPVARGRQVYRALDCGRCHQIGSEGARVGPELTHVGTAAEERRPGAAREYLRASLQDPGSYLVPGYRDTMPRGLTRGLSPTDLEALVAYLGAQR